MSDETQTTTTDERAPFASKQESALDAARRLGWEDPNLAEAKAATAKKAPKLSAHVEAELSALRSLAKTDPAAAKARAKKKFKELGLRFDGGKFLSEQRERFRNGQRKDRERLMAERARDDEAVREARTALVRQRAQIEPLIQASRDSDLDGIAEWLGHEDGADGLLEHFTDHATHGRFAREVREYRRSQQQTRQAEHQQLTAAQQRQQAAAQQEYVRNLGEEMRQHRDPIVRAAAELGFAPTLYAVQQDHWDGTRPISIAEAMKHTVPGGSASLETYLRDLFSSLDPVFAESAKPKPRPTPRADWTPQQWRDHADRALRRAWADDDKANAKRKAGVQ